ncbi:MAG: 2-oxoisovalerate dehydrogenase [Ignavibacteriaceae bacterium]
MKNKEIIFIIEESVDGGYEARAAGFSIFTQGETIEEVKDNIVEAVRCHFDEKEMPSLINLRFLKEEVIAL